MTKTPHVRDGTATNVSAVSRVLGVTGRADAPSGLQACWSTRRRDGPRPPRRRRAAPGLVDLAVNVRHQADAVLAGRPGRGRPRRRWPAYPDARPATAAVAARHGRPADEVLLTAGAAAGASCCSPRPCAAHAAPVVVHPQFTEPEAALRHAGHRVDRVLLREADGFRLDPDAVPADADLVFVGNPTNPTSVLHPAADVAALARPGRVLVVDEAFADTTSGPGCRRARVAGRPPRPARPGGGAQPDQDLGAGRAADRLPARPGRPARPAGRRAAALGGLHPGAGRRDRRARRRPRSPPNAQIAARARRRPRPPGAPAAGRARASPSPADPASAFVAAAPRPAPTGYGSTLRERGYAVRRGDTFPGLGPDWLRVAVRDTATTDAFIATLTRECWRIDRDLLETTHRGDRPARRARPWPPPATCRPG